MSAGLVLASASPRRREILEALGVTFDVVVPELDERTEGDPQSVVLENARLKARAGRDVAGSRRLILGADTEVVLDGRVLGKATDEDEARTRLEALSGRDHLVLGAIVLLGEDGSERSGVARSTVTFRELSSEIVDLYLASGEWRDRAGAYAIQGLGAVLIERVEGDFSNVVGLPISLLLDVAPELLQKV